MGGSTGNTDGVSKAGQDPEPGGIAVSLLEKIRRALGRLVAGTAVHDVPAAKIVIQPGLLSLALSQMLQAATGRNEGFWRIEAAVSPKMVPEAAPGAGNLNLAAVPARITENIALHPAAQTTHRALLPDFTQSIPIHSVTSGLPRGVAVLSRTVQFPADSLQLSRIEALARPHIEKLSTMPVQKPAVRQAWPLEKRGGDRSPAVRIKNGTQAACELPLLRVRETMDNAAEFLERAEWRQLAASAQAPLVDIAPIGIFRHIPITMVRKWALAEGGTALRIWLKTESFHSAVSPKIKTLVIGRRRSTKQIIQTLV